MLDWFVTRRNRRKTAMANEPFWFVLLSIDRPTQRDYEILRRTFLHFQERHIEISWPHTYDFGGERHFLFARCMPEDAERLKIEATQFFQAEYEAMAEKKDKEGQQ